MSRVWFAAVACEGPNFIRDQGVLLVLGLLLIPGVVLAGQFTLGSGLAVDIGRDVGPGVVVESGYALSSGGGLRFALPLSLGALVGGNDADPMPWLAAEVRYRWHFGGNTDRSRSFASVGTGAGFPPELLVFPMAEIGLVVVKGHGVGWEWALRDRACFFKQDTNAWITERSGWAFVNVVELVSALRFGK